MTSAQPIIAPYGSWVSPITANLVAEAGVALGGLQAAGGGVFWLELRPMEDGRYVLVQRTADGVTQDVTPPGHSARTLVHEYGGGSYALHATSRCTTVIYSEFDDQRLYRQDIGNDQIADPQPITRPPARARALRFSDGRVTPDGRLLVAVRESHEDGSVTNELVAVLTSPRGTDQLVLTGGRDFYAAPRVSPDGRLLAWLCWDHPQMPWDGTELWVGELSATGLGRARRVAGGPSESIAQPAWDGDGRLHYVSDRTGWWNLYRSGALDAPEDASAVEATPLAPLAAEFAKPGWVFGLQSYAFRPDGSIVCFYSENGLDHLAIIEPDIPGLRVIPCDYSTFSHIATCGDTVALIGGSPGEGSTVALVDVQTGELERIRRGTDLTFDRTYLSRPEPILFPTSYEPGTVSGPILQELEKHTSGLRAHALYYPPANPGFQGPEDQWPPLVVMCHGGPTSARESILSLDVQFWTTRGVAVVDVNYGGSTGYGRAYRERLRGNWGIVDTVDCINAARYLVNRGQADPARIAIQGGSAGGYTTLNALTRHRFFSAGASYYGLADLEVFATGGTHKFESRYLDGLVGPYPEGVDALRERSPIHHVRDIACPVILLQGLEDAIVPPEQAEIIVAALRADGLPFAYLAFPGEQHGFRKAENIVRAHEAVLSFYGRIFGFTPADSLEPPVVENMV